MDERTLHSINFSLRKIAEYCMSMQQVGESMKNNPDATTVLSNMLITSGNSIMFQANNIYKQLGGE